VADAYRNPVVPGFHPDPSVCRAGDQYFLVTSSFTYVPGVPIFRSSDLVHWVQIGNVLDRRSQLDLSGTAGWASLGVFAPTIRHHDGRFWMVTTTYTDRGADNFFVTAEDPAGDWSDPTHVDVGGIDPDLAWDDDGCWLSYSGGGAAAGAIMRTRIDDRTGALLEPPEPTWSGTGLQYPEAPHLFRRGDTWYLLVAEGGTERGHAVSIARGPSARGPWEGCPANPILTHRSTDRPIQNTGHADLVEATDGSWWMVALGTRPRGMTPMYHVLGRETFLAPVEWTDGWPVVADLAIDMPYAPPGRHEPAPTPVRDDFEGSELAPSWIGVRAAPESVASLDERPGWLTVHGDGSDLDASTPAFVGRRQQHLRCRVRVRVDAARSTEAGVAVRMDEHHHYEVFVAGGSIGVRARIGPLRQDLAIAPVPATPVVLGIDTVDGVAGPDEVRLGHEAADGSFVVLAGLDGRYLSTEVAGGFLGRVIGVYVVAGVASFDWFAYEGTDP
jgi:beta-xylosidase